MAKSNDQQARVRTPKFRVAFPHVFEPQAPQKAGDKPKYSLLAIFDSEEDLTALKRLAAAAVRAKWGDNKPANLRSPFRDGAEKAEKYDGFEAGQTFITISSFYKPEILNKVGGKPIYEDTEFYGGCYAMAMVHAYTYDNSGNCGVAFGLNNVLKVADGDPFTSRSSAAEDFADAIEEGDEAAPEASADDDMFS